MKLTFEVRRRIAAYVKDKHVKRALLEQCLNCGHQDASVCYWNKHVTSLRFHIEQEMLLLPSYKRYLLWDEYMKKHDPEYETRDVFGRPRPMHEDPVSLLGTYGPPDIHHGRIAVEYSACDSRGRVPIIGTTLYAIRAPKHATGIEMGWEKLAYTYRDEEGRLIFTTPLVLQPLARTITVTGLQEGDIVETVSIYTPHSWDCKGKFSQDYWAVPFYIRHNGMNHVSEQWQAQINPKHDSFARFLTREQGLLPDPERLWSWYTDLRQLKTPWLMTWDDDGKGVVFGKELKGGDISKILANVNYGQQSIYHSFGSPRWVRNFVTPIDNEFFSEESPGESP